MPPQHAKAGSLHRQQEMARQDNVLGERMSVDLLCDDESLELKLLCKPGITEAGVLQSESVPTI
ncbi:hypothetical protein E2C01_058984 [Portunus trituberculatus]|uniref:Uncharacterized protein n=1 Tax=Portunus trituberculatus TaxID=210409 RepID=A0A5B7H1B0_PORTR|nr:hypothetical protein [Portunus trituberculatus]